MQTLFISDLHLGHRDPRVVRGFLDFLQVTAADADSLYILGDFFDAWIGDDDDDPLATEIKAALAQYSAHHPTYFIHGNRDFLIGEKFCRDTGITLLEEHSVINLGERKVLLMHGDTLCTKDLEYMEFRAMVHSPEWQQQVLSLPLPQRRAMAAELRDKSLSLNAIKAEDIMDVTPTEVQRVMEQFGTHTLIHGHTHRPARHQLEVAGESAERWVLGDWHDTGWYISADPSGQLNLVEFELAP